MTEDGALIAFTRPNRLWLSCTTGQVTFEVTPNRFHDAWRTALTVLQFGPVDWLLGKLLDWGLELLPGRLSDAQRNAAVASFGSVLLSPRATNNTWTSPYLNCPTGLVYSRDTATFGQIRWQFGGDVRTPYIQH